MSVFGVCCLVLLLVAVGIHSISGTGLISFPSHISKPAATDEGQYDSQTMALRFSEGIGAVRSISNVVLKVLDDEQVRQSSKNWVVSPLSLAAILAQLLLGSRGNLLSVLADTLSLEKRVKPQSRLEVHRQLGKLMKYLQRPANDSYILDLNAAVFLQPEILLKPTYKHALLDFYNAQIHIVDFLRRSGASTKKINEWIKESTHGKLPQVYDHPLPPSTVSVMANVVYFNGRWENPFDPLYTKIGPFMVTPEQKVNVEYMFGEKEILYRNTSDMLLVGVPYKNWDVVLYILLPHDKLKTSLSVDHLDEIISTAVKENVTLSMPKLKLLSTISVRQSVLKYLMKSTRLATRSVILSTRSNGEGYTRRKRYSVNDHWQGQPMQRQQSQEFQRQPVQTQQDAEMEMDEILDDAEKFDVGGASEDFRFKFNDVIHQVSLEIDEKGSEIAAVSSSILDYSAHMYLVKINRPFWFFVRHEPTLTHLFWGRIVDPSNEIN